MSDPKDGSGSRLREEHLFKCTKCNHEVRLQAWKAVCPSCGSAFTLVRVVRPRVRLKIMPRHLTTASLAFVTAHEFLMPGSWLPNTVAQPYSSLLIMLLVVTALLALTGSVFSNVLTAACGAVLTFFGLASTYLLVLGPSLIVLGIGDELLVRWMAARRLEE